MKYSPSFSPSYSLIKKIGYYLLFQASIGNKATASIVIVTIIPSATFVVEIAFPFL